MAGDVRSRATKRGEGSTRWFPRWTPAWSAFAVLVTTTGSIALIWGALDRDWSLVVQAVINLVIGFSQVAMIWSTALAVNDRGVVLLSRWPRAKPTIPFTQIRETSVRGLGRWAELQLLLHLIDGSVVELRNHRGLEQRVTERLQQHPEQQHAEQQDH